MRNGVFYLNNSGSRWVVLINGNKEKRTFKTKSNKDVERTILYYANLDDFVNFNFNLYSYLFLHNFYNHF